MRTIEATPFGWDHDIEDNEMHMSGETGPACQRCRLVVDLLIPVQELVDSPTNSTARQFSIPNRPLAIEANIAFFMVDPEHFRVSFSMVRNVPPAYQELFYFDCEAEYIREVKDDPSTPIVQISLTIVVSRQLERPNIALRGCSFCDRPLDGRNLPDSAFRVPRPQALPQIPQPSTESDSQALESSGSSLGPIEGSDNGSQAPDNGSQAPGNGSQAAN